MGEGEGELISIGKLLTGLKKAFKTSYLEVLIKIPFEFTRTYKLQKIIKSDRILFNTS